MHSLLALPAPTLERHLARTIDGRSLTGVPWISLPDSDTSVILKDSQGEVGEGFHDGECWRWASSTRCGKIKAWADMPEGIM